MATNHPWVECHTAHQYQDQFSLQRFCQIERKCVVGLIIFFARFVHIKAYVFIYIYLISIDEFCGQVSVIFSL